MGTGDPDIGLLLYVFKIQQNLFLPEVIQRKLKFDPQYALVRR